MPDRSVLPTKPQVSVVITTRNRCSDLLMAVESCFAQTGIDLEVLVYDDQSTDETASTVLDRFPSVRLFTSTEREGYIVNRNRGFRDATAPLVFSLDDDAYFVDPQTLRQVVGLFAAHEQVAAVAVPYIEPKERLSESSKTAKSRPARGGSIRSYVGCSHAVRVDLALGAGGYREIYVHQGEERDLCLRLVEAGFEIRYAEHGFVVHTVSTKRDSNRVNFYGIRNRVLFDWLNLPLMPMLFRMIWDPVASIRYRFDFATLPDKLRAVAAGYACVLRYWRHREPVRAATYRAWCRLPAHGPEPHEGEVPGPARLSAGLK